jgi:hypothetical protein
VTRIWQAFVLALTLGFTALPGAHPPGLILDTPFNSLSAVRKNMIRIIQDCPRVDRELLVPQRSRGDTALVVHRDFLLFDFKQNLRHWPVLSGNINRSPPCV